MAQHAEDGHGGCVICHEYVPHTDDDYIRVAWPCPASRLPDYEAAVEALETLLMSFGEDRDGSVFVNVHGDGIFDFPKDVYAARAALARLREGEPSNV